MAIDSNTQTQIRSFIESISSHDFIIPEEDKDNFWQWFKTNAINLPILQANTENYKDILKPGRCYGNSQMISKSVNNEYIEGFMKFNTDFIPHGFNGNGSSYLDYTISAFPQNYKRYNNTLPSNYIGISIPIPIIEALNPEVEKYPNNNKSLLYDYFKCLQ